MLAPYADWLLARHTEADDLSLAEWRDMLMETHGVRVPEHDLCFLDKRGYSFKKTLFATEQHREATAAARAAWRDARPSLDPDRLIFLDETGTSANMVRTHGRSPRGRRLLGYAPHGHWKVATFVSGLRSTGIVAPLLLDCPMNSTIFRQYVAPHTRPTSIRSSRPSPRSRRT